jgi:uncharacterized RDD family membrane protein YckC
MAHANAVPVSGSALDNRRVLAALIDLLIVGAGFALILAAAGDLGEAGAGGALTAVGVGWALYYYFACESSDSGQTLGKRAMKIRVVSADGAPATMRQVALRTVLRVVDGLFVYLVGLIVMLATRERRGRLGDLVGGTMIVSADKPAPVVDMSAPEAPAAVSRVPIAESGPAFAPVMEVEEEPDVASPSLKELASDVTAVTEAPEREVEEEPEVEELPPAAELPGAEELPEADVVVLDEEPAAEDEPAGEPVPEDEPAAEEEPAEEPAAEEPAAEEAPVDEPEEEPAEEMTVKSVETVSAIDLVMEDQAEEAVAAPSSKARQS